MINISDAKNGTPSAQSGFFSIYSQKVLRVIFPNGGEFIWQDTLVTWISSNINNVNLEYTEDNGQHWNTIITNYPSTGAYYWNIGAGLPSTLARIRVTDASDPTITDMSDNNFNLRIKAGLKIEEPSGKNIYSGGSDMSISWTSDNKISSVKIEYWSDNTKSWHLIADNVASTYKRVNNYLWKGIPQSVGNILIKITDNNGKYSAKSGTVTIN
jgi:hypothetical protein